MAVAITSSCSSDGSYVARSPQIHVRASRPCPATIAAVGDVSNASSGLTHSLVPRRDAAEAGLICEYGPGTAGVLARTVSLDNSKASKLTRALAAVSLKHPSGKFHCPNDDRTVAIMAFRYSGRAEDVDVWYGVSGCGTLDNGYVSAFEGANASFYDRFVAAFQQVTA